MEKPTSIVCKEWLLRIHEKGSFGMAQSGPAMESISTISILLGSLQMFGGQHVHSGTLICVQRTEAHLEKKLHHLGTSAPNYSRASSHSNGTESNL